MKGYLVATCAAAATLACGSAFAADVATAEPTSPLLHAVEGKVSANIDFTTDYRFRGISQTDRDFAVQGGFDYTMNSGFYLGTWASNVDNFNPNPFNGDNGAQAEVDLYGGYNYSFNDQWAAGVNVLYYYYPGASTAGANNEIDFWEYTPKVSYNGQNLNASLGVSLSDDYFNESGFSYYPSLDVSTPLTGWLTFAAHVGYQGIDKNSVWGTPDYADWKIAFSTEQFGLNWEVAYVDTDLSDQDCFAGDNICGATAVGTISKSF